VGLAISTKLGSCVVFSDYKSLLLWLDLDWDCWGEKELKRAGELYGILQIKTVHHSLNLAVSSRIHFIETHTILSKVKANIA